MEKQELERFNQKLIDDFSYYSDGRPKFRIVWSEDELEKRVTYYSKEGLELLTSEVIEVPKYRQWIHNRWVLEQLTPIPNNHGELSVGKLSYEPIWTFQNKSGDYLEPKYEAAKFIINTILGQTFSPSNLAKYKTTNQEERESRIRDIENLEELLYGNESKIGDALAQDTGVGYGSRNRNDSFNPTEKVTKATGAV